MSSSDTQVQRPRGQYFEEFEIGAKLTSPGRTITEADILWFAGLSGDFNELHTNVEFAKGTPFGKPIAHGLLCLSVASGLASRLGFIEGTAIAFRSLEWKFKAPVFAGDTIRVVAEASEKRAIRAIGGGMVTFKVSLLNQRDETVQEGTWSVLVKSRPADTAAAQPGQVAA